MPALVEKTTYQKHIDDCRGKEGKHVFWLSEEQNGYRIGCVVFNNVLPSAEVHTQAVDVWYVVEGAGKFNLGGELENGIEKKPNEWVAPSILGGETREVKPGDVISIPPNVPHQIDARDSFLATLIVKISN